jgi:hypothetical protein
MENIMADLDDDAITVTLPAEEGGAVIEKVVESKATPAADDPISDLKGQFEQLKGTLNHRDQQIHLANQQLVEKDKELAEVRKEVVTSQLDTVTTGIQAAEADASAAEHEYADALEKGDFAAQARATRKISAAESRIQRLKEAEGDLKDQAAPKPAPRQEARTEPRQGQQDPVEAVASTMTPRAAAWIRSHPDYVTDRSKNSKMLATHYAALSEGLKEGGDEYFARLDAMANPTQRKEEPGKVNIRPSAPVAPAGNSAGGMNGGGMTVTLTKREVESANDGSIVWNRDDPGGKFKKDTPIGTQEFARRKSIMQKQGHYDKSYSE